MDLKKIFKIISIAGIIGMIVLMVWCYQQGLLTDQEKMQTFLAQYGMMGIIIFIIIQVVQVVIPIIPGGVSCLAGVVAFGSIKGFIYNYIGICIGSVIAFLIAKKYGRPVLYKIFDKKTIEKYESWTSENNRFTKLFAAAIFFPVAPDDFLCYLAGTTKMKASTFTAIILLAKPFSIAIYSMGLALVFQRLLAGI